MSFVSGGLLLLVVDSLLNIIGHYSGTLLPAGAMTGVHGAPFLIYLVLRQRKSQGIAREAPPSAPAPRLTSWQKPLLGLAALAALAVLLQGFTAGADGWGWHWQGDIILEHRLPRSLSAVAVGILLASAGVLLQTLTRNPMASPEVLGISSGVALAVLAAFIAFSARGFAIDKYQVDGMNVNWADQWVAGESLADTGIYDRVEIVRGATGLMTGAGNPSASVNLVRKHADSSERKTALEAGVGRYGDLKLSADHSQPLTASGNLRGRIIANHQGGKTFVDREKDKSSTLYGVLDADITPTTSASLGISHQRSDKDGAMWGGLPVTYTDGSITHWKRGKSDSTNWAYWDSRTTNLFIEGKQALNDNWNVSLKADHRNAKGDSELFYFSGSSVNRNGLDWTPWPGKFHTDAKQNNIQLQADGKFQAWGQSTNSPLASSTTATTAAPTAGTKATLPPPPTSTPGTATTRARTGAHAA